MNYVKARVLEGMSTRQIMRTYMHQKGIQSPLTGTDSAKALWSLCEAMGYTPDGSYDDFHLHSFFTDHPDAATTLIDWMMSYLPQDSDPIRRVKKKVIVDSAAD
jgi:hypothetical protein